jgi:hypothetical protein
MQWTFDDITWLWIFLGRLWNIIDDRLSTCLVISVHIYVAKFHMNSDKIFIILTSILTVWLVACSNCYCHLLQGTVCFTSGKLSGMDSSCICISKSWCSAVITVELNLAYQFSQQNGWFPKIFMVLLRLVHFLTGWNVIVLHVFRHIAVCDDILIHHMFIYLLLCIYLLDTIFFVSLFRVQISIHEYFDKS